MPNEMPAGGFEVEIRENFSYRDILSFFLESSMTSPSPRDLSLITAPSDLILSKLFLEEVTEKSYYRLNPSILAFCYTLRGKEWSEQKNSVEKKGLTIPKALTAFFIALTLQKEHGFQMGYGLYRTSSIVQLGHRERIYIVSRNGDTFLEHHPVDSWNEGKSSCGAFVVLSQPLFPGNTSPII